MTAGTLTIAETCKCSLSCEHPCWLRVGLTSAPCCAGCPPLPTDAELDALNPDRSVWPGDTTRAT